MTRQQAIEAAEAYYTQRRNEESLRLRQREDEVRAAHPEIGDLMARRAELPLKSLRLAMQDRAGAAAVAQSMKNEGIALNLAIRQALKKAGYSEDYLKPAYECSICRDTGYIPDAVPARPCACYEKRVLALMSSRESGETAQTFESFDPNVFPEDEVEAGYTQRQHALDAKDLCETYANSYPNTGKPNLLITGNAGLGKTYLLNCIAARVREKGYPVYSISSFELMQILRARHFNETDSGEGFTELLNAPLLLIDDLGSEPHYNGIMDAYLCELLNERLLNSRRTVITTNFTMPQLKETYGERIFSRMCDDRLWDHLRLKGRDLRRKNGQS
ncbi:MAG: ATP-binding protein [Clostridia bacterium]|nr:ATP-binding protein [Clostridia bacterium]